MTNPEQRFVHLDARTFWTPGSVAAPDTYPAAAAALGMEAVGMADRDSIRGWPEFDRAALAAGVKPVFALEKSLGSHRLTMVAVSDEGIRSLTQLVGATVVTPDDLVRHGQGLFVIAPPETAAQIADAVDRRRLYVEVPSPDVHRWQAVQTAQQQAERFGLKALVSNRAWEIEPKPYSQLMSFILYSRSLVAALPRQLMEPRTFARLADNAVAYRQIGQLAKSENVITYLASFRPGGWLKQASGAAVFSSPEHYRLLTNTLNIARASEVVRLPRPSLPRYPVPEGQTAHGLLRQRGMDAMVIRYRKLTPETLKRFEAEMSAIGNAGLSDHFLIAGDMARMMREQGILHTGMGSGTGSLVAYLLDITAVDPVRNHLSFERFLTDATAKVPDIDWSVDPLKVDRLMARMYREFPEWDCYPYVIRTHPTYGIAGALRMVMSVFDIPKTEVDSMIKAVEAGKQADRVYAPYAQIALEVAAAGIPHGNAPEYPSKTVLTHMPVESGYTTKDDRIIDITKKTAETWSNFDLVPNYGLSVIDQVCNDVGLEADRIPDDDPETMRMIFRGDTKAVPFIGTKWLREVLRDVGGAVDGEPTLDDLTAAFALSRPGGRPSLTLYIARRSRRQPVSEFHPVITEVLGETYGTLIYQEQVRELAVRLAGFTTEEAETLRKMITKERDRDTIETWRRRFTEGAVAGGLSQDIADKLFSRMTQFAEYGLLKGHTRAIMREIAYRAAYLKRHYPLEYAIRVAKIGQYTRSLEDQGQDA